MLTKNDFRRELRAWLKRASDRGAEHLDAADMHRALGVYPIAITRCPYAVT